MSNLNKRLITGTALAIGMAAILFGDEYIDIQKRFMPVCMILLTIATSLELMGLLSIPRKGVYYLLPLGLILIIALQWGTYYRVQFDWAPTTEKQFIAPMVGLHVIPVMLMVLVLVYCLQDGLRFFTYVFMMIYLGLPALVLMKIQHLPEIPILPALAATIFVPKLGDVGAFFTGTLIGKHKMAPKLSPKKTWEGFAGGIIAAILTAVGINEIGTEPLFKDGVLQAMLFGGIVGLAGVLGDLFESAIKRRANAKDAAASVPGFGGVLDVVDSVLFAAPVAYLFFVLM